jgi:hypothetical protein
MISLERRPGQVCFTLDTWSGNRVRHFIDLINFQSAVFSLDLAPCRCFLGLGCSRTEIAARSRVSVIMRRLRGRLVVCTPFERTGSWLR